MPQRPRFTHTGHVFKRTLALHSAQGEKPRLPCQFAHPVVCAIFAIHLADAGLLAESIVVSVQTFVNTSKHNKSHCCLMSRQSEEQLPLPTSPATPSIDDHNTAITTQRSREHALANGSFRVRSPISGLVRRAPDHCAPVECVGAAEPESSSPRQPPSLTPHWRHFLYRGPRCSSALLQHVQLLLHLDSGLKCPRKNCKTKQCTRRSTLSGTLLSAKRMTRWDPPLLVPPRGHSLWCSSKESGIKIDPSRSYIEETIICVAVFKKRFTKGVDSKARKVNIREMTTSRTQCDKEARQPRSGGRETR